MISYSKVLITFTIGSGATLLATMMIYAAFSQFFIDNLLYSIDVNDFAMAAIIILSLVFITFVSSFLISVLVSTNINKDRVMFASILTFLFSFLFLSGISILIIKYGYPSYIDDLSISGFEYFFVLPALCIFYLGVYVMGQFIYLMLVIILLYYLIFVMILWVMESRDN